MENLLTEIKNKLASFGVPSGASVLIAFSGGRDSVVLLDTLVRIAPLLQLRLGVAYVNHQLRGEESLEESRFVETLVAREYRLPLFIKEIPQGFLDELPGESVESGARKIRYQFFREIAAREHFDYIATAHHLDDRIETFFINILRGGGSETLRAIPQQNGTIIRPLIGCNREAINGYIAAHALSYVEDSSNARMIYLRNTIRHRILPLLKELTPDLYSSFGSTFSYLEEDMNYLDECAGRELERVLFYKTSRLFVLHCALFSELPAALRSRIIKKLCRTLDPAVGLTREFLRGMTRTGRISLRVGSLLIESKGAFLWFVRMSPAVSFSCSVASLPYKDQCVAIEQCEALSAEHPVISRSALPVVIETLRPDERITLKKGTVSIIKRLGEKGVPEQVARTAYVIRDHRGTVAGYWCEPFFEVTPELYLAPGESGILIRFAAGNNPDNGPYGPHSFRKL